MYEYDGETGDIEESMHFPILESNGGIYDDDAFIAGWNLCVLDTKLAEYANERDCPPPQTLPIEYYEQIDLLAMRYGYTVVLELEEDDDEYGMYVFKTGKRTLT